MLLLISTITMVKNIEIDKNNGCVKFECNDRYHCIRKIILNQDDDSSV